MPLLIATLLVFAADRAHPAWMVGTWGWRSAGERASDCGTDHDESYERNGRYYFIDEVGRWRIEGNRLIVTTRNGKPSILRFVRIAPGVLRLRGAAGAMMIKCRGG